MRSYVSLVLIFALLIVSGAPLVSSTVYDDGMMEASCSASHMKMASMGHMQVNAAQQPTTKGMRHCHIECCGHQDVASLPHQLAPHAPALCDIELAPAMTGFITAAMPVLQPRLFSVPFPPPKFS